MQKATQDNFMNIIAQVYTGNNQDSGEKGFSDMGCKETLQQEEVKEENMADISVTMGRGSTSGPFGAVLKQNSPDDSQLTPKSKIKERREAKAPSESHYDLSPSDP